MDLINEFHTLINALLIKLSVPNSEQPYEIPANHSIFGVNLMCYVQLGLKY